VTVGFRLLRYRLSSLARENCCSLALISHCCYLEPKLDQIFNAKGRLNDVNDVKIGLVAASAFAFVADGKSGLRVLEFVSPWDDPAHFSGFSPRPTPKLIATARTRGPALVISKGIDRDRAVDESGNQLAVFGRRGARPLNRTESSALYLRSGATGPHLYTVTDDPAESPAAAHLLVSSQAFKTNWLDRARSWFSSLLD
jgi:hypothetical protein